MKEITTAKNILTENSELLQDFFKDINRYPIYSGEEQIELARKMREGDESAREKLITSNLKFVVTCAKQYVGQGVPLMDLISSGIEGLILSLRNYDPDRGYKVLSFAVWYIRREILRTIYNHGRTIRYPTTYINNITKVKRAYNDFVNKNGRDPSDEELLNLTNLTQKQYNSTVLNKSNCISLDVPISEEDDSVTMQNILAVDNDELSNVFTRDAIERCLHCLNAREYKVITEFYGLNGVEAKSIKEIAAEMDLGDERIRQLRKGGIKKLKEKCGNILKTLL